MFFFFWGSYMIYSGSWSPQLQLPRLSLWMSQRASPCRGWLSKTITTWLWPTEALKLVVQHETHHVSSCFNPSPKYQQYPTVSNSQYVRWVHGDDHPISRRWTHTHTHLWNNHQPNVISCWTPWKVSFIRGKITKGKKPPAEHWPDSPSRTAI